MNGKPAVVLCSHARCAPNLIDMERLAASVAKSEVLDRLVVLEEPCRAVPETLTAIRKRKVVFAGCPLLKENGFYEQTARRLVISRADWLAINLKADVLDLYQETKGIEGTVCAVLESLGQLLYGTQAANDTAAVAHRRVLVYGSGMSGLTAALGLASEGISVDVMETDGCPASPGCLGELLQNPRLLDDLRDKARRDERILLLPSGARADPTPVEGGFLIRSSGGDAREYGSIVFAPERRETPPEESGAFTLTQLYGYMASGRAVGGRVVVLLDRDGETEPEVFRDVLLAAAHLTRRMQAEVLVLCRNARVSLAGTQELYDECRQMGILFIRYRDTVSIASGYGDFVLRGIDDHTSAAFVIEKPKILVIPGRMGLAPEARALAGALALRLEGDRAAQPDCLWREVNATNRAGVFAMGDARGSRAGAELRESSASLARAIQERLSPGGIRIEEHIPVVNKETCAYCLTCVQVCPFGAMEKDPVERTAKVRASACRACGLCAAECPAQAIEIRNLGSTNLRAGMQALVR